MSFIADSQVIQTIPLARALDAIAALVHSGSEHIPKHGQVEPFVGELMMFGVTSPSLCRSGRRA